MAGAYGNDNLAFVISSQYVTVDTTSDLSAAIPTSTQSITLYSTSDCWVNLTEPGKDTPAAAAIGSEKTEGDSWFLPASTMVDVPVPKPKDNKQVKVAVVRATADGVLYIWHRNETN